MSGSRAEGHECYHCKQWIEPGQAHDCWTTIEAALTEELTEDLRQAWERIRETAVEFGDQRIYASGSAIMFSRKRCYFFVRPHRTFLELWVFLGRGLKAPQVRRVERSSASKVANLIHIRHRDEVESPVTDWLREAYDLPDKLAALAGRPAMRNGQSAKRKSPAKQKGPARRKRSTKRKQTAKRTRG